MSSNFNCSYMARSSCRTQYLKGTHPGTIPARFGLIWFSGFRGKDLNVIFYQNMPICIIGILSAKKNFTEKPGIYVKLLLAMSAVKI